jgi:hypothetical protein
LLGKDRRHLVGNRQHGSKQIDDQKYKTQFYETLSLRHGWQDRVAYYVRGTITTTEFQSSRCRIYPYIQCIKMS